MLSAMQGVFKFYFLKAALFLLLFLFSWVCTLPAQDFSLPDSGAPSPAVAEKALKNPGSITVKADKIVVVAPDEKTLKALIEGKTGEQAKKEKPKPSTGGMLDAIIEARSLSALWEAVKLFFTDELFSWQGFELWKIVFLFIGVVVTLVVSYCARWIVESFIAGKIAKRTKTQIDDQITKTLGSPISLFFLSLGINISATPMISSFPDDIHYTVDRVFIAVCAAAIAWGIYRMVNVLEFYLLKKARSSDTKFDDIVVYLIRKSLKITIAVVSVLFIGQNILGLNITTLLAGMGVFGLAIAFAAKDTIANFFGSLMIIIDKPFKVGQRIIVEGVEGNVERVGLRSTRIRTLSGHLVTIPNSSVANVKVENVGERPYIKFKHDITLVYDTPPEKLERAIEILHEIYRDHEGMSEDRMPRIYFNSFNDWALNIMVILWYHPGDYFAAQDWNHRMNFEILKRFNAEGLEFAFPTNTTYLAYDEKRKLALDVNSQ